MSNQHDKDISNIQVPQSLIQEILDQTQPLEESREEIYPAQETAQTVPQAPSQDGQIVNLLSLLFEEFDKLNSRFDSLQKSVNEITTVGAGAPFQKFALGSNGKRPSKHPECDAQAELEGKKGRTKLESLLAQRLGR